MSCDYTNSRATLSVRELHGLQLLRHVMTTFFFGTIHLVGRTKGKRTLEIGSGYNIDNICLLYHVFGTAASCEPSKSRMADIRQHLQSIIAMGSLLVHTHT